MCHFGGPTGVNSDQPSGPVVLHHFGQGVAVGDVVPARSAVATGCQTQTTCTRTAPWSRATPAPASAARTAERLGVIGLRMVTINGQPERCSSIAMAEPWPS